MTALQVTELTAFGHLSAMKGKEISDRSVILYSHITFCVDWTSTCTTCRSFTIATYALCSFANFPSIGIQIGGFGAMAEERKADIASLALRCRKPDT